MNKLEQREREVQALLTAGEEVIQSTSCCDSESTTRSNMVEESPLGFQWEVPDFSDMLSVVAKSTEPLAKRGPPEYISDSSPLKRARSLAHGYEGISENAKRLTSMMSDMTERLARLSDPQYLDDLATRQSSASQPKPDCILRFCNLTQRLDQLSDPQFLDDLWALQSSASLPELSESKVNDEVEALRQDNQKLQASLIEAEREKAEMSKVLMVMEDRLTKSNDYLREIACLEQVKKPMYKISCGSALLSSKARQCPTNSSSSSRSSTSRAIINGNARQCPTNSSSSSRSSTSRAIINGKAQQCPTNSTCSSRSSTSRAITSGR